MEATAKRCETPNQTMVSEFNLKKNAFLHPNDPDAVIPQFAKPDILDFRSHKMIGGGLTGANNFRKMYSANAKKSKYAAVIRTPEMIAADERKEAIAKQAKLIEQTQR